MINQALLSATLMFALAVGELLLSTTHLNLDTPDPVSVTIVALYNLAMFFGSQCTEGDFLVALAITSEFTTSMKELANSCLLNLQFRVSTCWKLVRSVAMAHTKLSTKIISEKYSDL